MMMEYVRVQDDYRDDDDACYVYACNLNNSVMIMMMVTVLTRLGYHFLQHHLIITVKSLHKFQRQTLS